MSEGAHVRATVDLGNMICNADPAGRDMSAAPWAFADASATELELCSVSASRRINADITWLHNATDLSPNEVAPPPAAASRDVLASVWHPTPQSLPYIGAVAVLVYAALIRAVRHRRNAADIHFERRRMHQVLERLARVRHEYEENIAARRRYFERKALIEAHARDAAASIGATDWEEHFNHDAAACGFSHVELRPELQPKRFVEAIVDAITDRPVDELPHVGRALGPKRAALFRDLFDAVHLHMLERTATVLERAVKLTADARADGAKGMATHAPPDPAGGKGAHANAAGEKLREALKQVDRPPLVRVCRQTCPGLVWMRDL